MKKKIEELLKAKKEQRNTLNKSMIESDNKEERMAIGETLSELGKEIATLESMLADMDEPAADGAASSKDEGEGRSMDVIASMKQGGAQERKKASDPYDTEEYRTAFMNFVCRGTKIPDKLIEKRDSDAWTTTSDASAVIPTTILNEMVKELKTYGNLYSRVRKLNVKGGVNIPILSLKPVATWITADTGTSESNKQKIQANTSISFNYFGLECKVAQTLLTSVTTLDMFQNEFATLAVEAIVYALDDAIINGTGSDDNQPLGIVNDERVPEDHIVTLSETDVLDWSEWKKQVFAKIPAAYRNGSFIMAQGTFDGYIDGMVDGNGQPIGRVNYGIDGGETYRFGGKEVLIVEPEIILDWDSADGDAEGDGDVVAVFCNLNDYAINSNMQMQTVKWVDHNTNEICNKVIMICDGKLVDPNGVVIVKKGV